VGDWSEIGTRPQYGTVRLDHLLSRESHCRPNHCSAFGDTPNPGPSRNAADSHVDHWLFGLSRRRRLDVLSRGSVTRVVAQRSSLFRFEGTAPGPPRGGLARFFSGPAGAA